MEGQLEGFAKWLYSSKNFQQIFSEGFGSKETEKVWIGEHVLSGHWKPGFGLKD